MKEPQKWNQSLWKFPNSKLFLIVNVIYVERILLAKHLLFYSFKCPNEFLVVYFASYCKDLSIYKSRVIVF